MRNTKKTGTILGWVFFPQTAQGFGQRTHEYLGYALNVLLARIHGCAPVGCRTPVCTFFPLKHKSVSIFPKAVAAAFR